MQGSKTRGEGWSLRPLHLVQQLSEVQVHQAEDCRRALPAIRLRRGVDRASLEAGQGLLRLLEISRLQFRSLEQTCPRTVPVLWCTLPDREDDQARRNRPLLQRRSVQIQSLRGKR